MLQLLRAVYPQACLVSEIVSAEEGKYLIRASVQIEGIAIGNVFAISHDVEVAQDRAFEKLLHILGVEAQSVVKLESNREDRNESRMDVEAVKAIEPPAISDSSPSIPTPVLNLDEVAPLPAAIPSSLIMETKTPLKPLLDIPPASVTKAPIEPAADANVPPESKPPVESVVPSPTPVTAKFSSEPVTYANISQDKPTVAPLPVPSATRSQLINLTDLEIKRLGWTKKQGSDYLNTKYGKKVRNELTDSELQDFCDYLQSL